MMPERGCAAGERERDLGAAEGLGDALGRGGRGLESGVGGIFLERLSERIDQSMEGSVVIFLRGLDRLFHAVIARNKNGVGGAHGGNRLVVSGRKGSPLGEPSGDNGRIVEQGAKGSVGVAGGNTGEVTKEEGVIDGLGGE